MEKQLKTSPHWVETEDSLKGVDEYGNIFKFTPQSKIKARLDFIDPKKKESHLGYLIQHGKGVIYDKKENLKDLQHNLIAWSIQNHIAKSVGYIRYTTKIGKYVIKASDAIKYGIKKPFGGDGLDKKIYVPLKYWKFFPAEPYWGVVYKRFGIEWMYYLAEPLKSLKMGKILSQIQIDKKNGIQVLPSPDKMFRAFKETPLDRVNVVILGQDPYHIPGLATGLSFGVEEGKTSSSLSNIKKELYDDVGTSTGLFQPKFDCTMQNWASQGVLMLNTSLSVRANEANSHKFLDWEDALINYVIDTLVKTRPDTVYVAWGSKAQTLLSKRRVNTKLIVASAHPSGLSAARGFFKSKPFSKVNAILKSQSKPLVNWLI